MPVPGRAPKPDGQKRNRVKPTYEWTEVPDVPFNGRVPALPKHPLGWPALTKRWWQAISRMPHCVLWTDTDWQYAIDTAVVAAAFHRGDVRAAAELRNREKVLGTTFDTRRALRIRYLSPDAEENEDDASVTALADYRAMLDDG
jgi:hypothetical protein